MRVAQNWPNLEKRPPFLQVSSKLSEFSLVKDLTNRLLLPLIVSFWEHTLFAWMRRLKNVCPLSVPPRAYFYHPHTLGLFMLRLFKSQTDEVMNLSNCLFLGY